MDGVRQAGTVPSPARHRPALLAAAAVALLVVPAGCGTTPSTSPPAGVDGLVAPSPDPEPADFRDDGVVGNPWLPLAPGAEWTYAESSPLGAREVRVQVVDDDREVAGVPSVGVRTVVVVDDEAVSERWRWYAEDRAGNVWLLAEEVERDGGGLAGVWEAGVDGAPAGLVVPAVPRVGDGWVEAWVPGLAIRQVRAEDLDTPAAVPAGEYDGGLLTEVTSPVRPGEVERRVHVRGTGLVRSERVLPPSPQRPAGATVVLALVSFDPGR